MSGAHRITDMNFLAHCFLAQPNRYSLYGNLLGDFIAGADLDNQPEQVLKGLENHKLVDRFTDAHEAITPLKKLMSKERRRFTGIISDVVFDYYLIKHWSEFTDRSLHDFIAFVYSEIRIIKPQMHQRMINSMNFMLNHDGLMVNSTIEGVGITLDRLSNRIRFKNNLAGAVEEVELNYDAFDASFMSLFPDLINAVEMAALE
jgi:acyl carrier protein phosphodiesterase